MTCNTSAVAVSSLQRLVTLGFALGKLTLHIGDKLLGIGYRAVGRRTHLRTFVGTDLSGGPYRIDTALPQVVDWDDQASIGEWPLSARPLGSARPANGCYSAHSRRSMPPR